MILAAVLIFKLHNDVAHSINRGDITGIVYVDVAKAFDNIHHGRLLNKLSMLGLSPGLVPWFETYLNRTQSTYFNNMSSRVILVPAGVPQGSVLGPLLFITYINDMCDVVTNCKMLLYADDCVLYCSHRKIENVQEKLQLDLTAISDWCSVNLLNINVG